MLVKTADLIGAALDWAVGVALGYEMSLYGVCPSIRARVPGLGVYAPWSPSQYWDQGGLIIEREHLWIRWNSTEGWRCLHGEFKFPKILEAFGPTPLIAAMRCYTASELSEYVGVPEKLCQQQKS